MRENIDYRWRPNQELYKFIEKITDVARKSIGFYRNILRMNPASLTNQLPTYWINGKAKTP